jgi:hypothetical protein
MAYQLIDVTVCITVNDWEACGNTYNQFRMDSQRGYLTIFRRGLHGNTLIDVSSIRRKEHMDRIEANMGKAFPDASVKSAFDSIQKDGAAAYFYQTYQDECEIGLTDEKKLLYANSASILNYFINFLEEHTRMRAKYGKRPIMCDFYSNCVKTVVSLNEQPEHLGGLPNSLPTNARRFEEKFREYRKFYMTDKESAYKSLIKRSSFINNAEKLTSSAKDWAIARWSSQVDKVTILQLFDEYNRRASAEPELKWKSIHEPRTLYLFLHKPEIKPLWFGCRFGELKFKEKYVRQHSTMLPTRRDSLWYGDGTKLNYFYRDANGKVATINVYEVMDVYSEVFLGYYISNSEDFEAQYHAYKMAMQTSGHKPYEIRFDNQGGHKKLQSSQFFKNLARLAITTQPYNGKSKTIESAFGRFQAEFLHRDWFFTGMNITAKSDESKMNKEFIYSNLANLPTLDEVIKIYEKRRREWNEAVHYDTGKRRIDMYNESKNEKTEKVNPWDMIILFGMMNSKPVKYRSNGIVMEVKKQKYQFEVLKNGMPDMGFNLRNIDREFYVGYFLEDMTTVALYEKTATGDYRYVTMAEKYIKIHRAKQEQDELDHALISAMDRANKKMRIDIHEKAEQCLERHGYHPAQHGLQMPKLKGISKKDYSVGKSLKAESNLVESLYGEEECIAAIY